MVQQLWSTDNMHMSARNVNGNGNGNGNEYYTGTQEYGATGRP